MSRFVLVHSPFLGPASWRGVAAALGRAGHRGDVAAYALDDAPSQYEAAGEAIGSSVVAAASSSILVTHSGAGALVPSIVHHTAAAAISGILFVDSVLPRPGKTWFDTAPTIMAEHLLAKVTDGRLPPWNDWYPHDPIGQLVTDPEARAEILAELPRVPVAFLRAQAPAFAGWESLPKAYLRLSKAYDGTADRAAEKGWPMERAALHHLAIVTEPDTVAGMLIDLSAQLK